MRKRSIKLSEDEIALVSECLEEYRYILMNIDKPNWIEGLRIATWTNKAMREHDILRLEAVDDILTKALTAKCKYCHSKQCEHLNKDGTAHCKREKAE